MTSPRHDEDHRRECEARYWINWTGGDKGKVESLIERIAKRRGRKAADELLREMRRQWARGI